MNLHVLIILVAQGRESFLGENTYRAEQCARFLSEDHLRPATQGQFGQPPSSNSTLWNWIKSKTGQDVLQEENSAEARN